MELDDIRKKRSAIRELSPLQEKLRKLMEKDRETLGLTRGEYASKLGTTWSDIEDFEQKKKVLSSRGRALSAICKHLKQSDLQNRITEVYGLIKNDRVFGLSLFTHNIINLVFDIHECQAKNAALSYESFSKLFGEDQTLVLAILNLSQDQISKLEDEKLYERIFNQLAGDDFSELMQLAIEEESASMLALCKRARDLRALLIGRYPTNRTLAEAIGVHATGLGDVLSYEGPQQSRKVYRSTAEKVVSALEAVYAGKKPAPKPEAEESAEPVTSDDISGAEELETNVRALLNSGMAKQTLADKLSIPRSSMAHILIRSAGAERVNKLLPITRDLLSQIAAPPLPPVVAASPKPASNGKVETPIRGDDKFYPVTNALVNALRNSAKALEICIATSGMVPRDREKHELARIVLMLADLGQLTAADLRDASDGRPLKDSPAALAMLQSLRG